MGFPMEDERGERLAKKDERFFIEGPSGSEDELDYSFNCQRRTVVPSPCADRSPPLVLAFPLTTAEQDSYYSSPASSQSSGLSIDSNQGLEYNEEPIEEWMILGGDEMEGDAQIHLNLIYSSSSEEVKGEASKVGDLELTTAPKHSWVVSEKDKASGLNQPISLRYFLPDRSLKCYNCNKTGHLAKGCPTPKRRPSCVLCGLQGHLQRGCPNPHCPSCGLPSHGQLACPEPPLWSRHCHRCGLTGHLTYACPDTWRQYHQTTQRDVPPGPPTGHAPRPGHGPAHCYNCSRRGHRGHECVCRRMTSGTFPSAPFICHYDTLQDLHQQDTRTQRRARELQEKGFWLRTGHPPTLEPAGGSSGEDHSSRRRSRSVELWAKEGQGKTWPERRRERREVKRLRKEAQAHHQRRKGDEQVPGRRGGTPQSTAGRGGGRWASERRTAGWSPRRITSSPQHTHRHTPTRTHTHKQTQTPIQTLKHTIHQTPTPTHINKHILT